MLFTILPPGPVTKPNDGRDDFEHDNVQLAVAFNEQRKKGDLLFVVMSETNHHPLALVKELLIGPDGSLLADVWPRTGTDLEVLKDFTALMPTLLMAGPHDGRLKAVRVKNLIPSNKPALEVQQ